MSAGHTNDEASFLDFLRAASAAEGRGNDELVRAIVPLMQQVLAHHDEGRVAPLNGVGRIFAAGGHLWFHDADATPPTIDRKALRKLETPQDAGVRVVDRTAETLDLTHDEAKRTERSRLIGEAGEALKWPVYLTGYLAWEHELGHHDGLTDIFSLGMLLASLAVGVDLTEKDELETLLTHRRTLTTQNPGLHPVIAKAIVRMTELDRHSRAQDLEGLIARLQAYRDVDETVDADLDFQKLKGFMQGDHSSRRKIIQGHLQSRLFDLTRRNRLVWFRSTLQTLDLTEASVPSSLRVERITPEELFLWQGPAGEALSAGRSFRLDRYLRFEEAPWIRGVLDQVRSQARRDRAEYGMSQLRLVVAFFNWHNLRDDAERRIRSPLLLLPVAVDKKRGVRDSYVLRPQSEIAEVNPVLRHYLRELYDLELPEHVDLSETDLPTFHRVLAAAIKRSEPAITLHMLERPQIRLIHKRARRRLEAWRRRSRVSGRGIRRLGDVNYSYGKRNFSPLGLQLFLAKVAPERLNLAEHMKGARVVQAPDATETREVSAGQGDPSAAQRGAGARVGSVKVEESEREVYQITEQAKGPYDWAVDLTHLTLGNFNYRKMSLVRDYDRMLTADEVDGESHPAFDALFSLNARPLALPDADVGDEGASAVPPSERVPADPFAPYLVLPADPTQAAAVMQARGGGGFIIQGPPGTGKSQTITNLIADFAARGKHVLFVCQKRAALDVVYHRLAQHGLDELSVLIHDSQADKKTFIQELGATYDRWLADLDGTAATPNDGNSTQEDDLNQLDPDARREALRAHLSRPLGALQRFSNGMLGPAAGSDASVVELLRERLRCPPISDLDATARELVPDHAVWHRHRAAVHAVGQALTDVGESAVVAHLGVRHVSAAVLEAAKPVSTLREGLTRVTELMAPVQRAQAEVKTGATTADLQEALVLARQLAGLARGGHLRLLDPSSDESLELQQFERRAAEAGRSLVKAKDATVAWRQKLSRADLPSARSLARRLDGLFVLFRFFIPGWWRLRGLLKQRYDFTRHALKPTWTEVLDQLNAEYDQEDAGQALTQAARDRFGFEGSLSEFRALVDALRDGSNRTPLQRELARRWREDGGTSVLALLTAERQIEALSKAAAAVFRDGECLSVDELQNVATEAAEAADLLPEVRSSLLQLVESPRPIRDAVCRVPLLPAQWDAAVCEAALRKTFRASRPLARFDVQTHARHTSELQARYDDWLEANADAVRHRVKQRFLAKVRQTARPAGQLDDNGKALKKSYNAGRRELEREFKKVMRHKSIRSLTDGDSGTVVYDLKPIWLMSPLSISDTLPLEEQRFDVVIFDEASQIPLEEAVPAVYRAPQMIVVGDEMQLPPTTFFAASQTSHDDDDEDDPTNIAAHYDLQAESFLTHAAQRLPSTLLGWHYRSRSEALIRFSNHAFYGGELLTIPDRTMAQQHPEIEVTSADQGRANAALITDRAVSFHHLTSSPYISRRNSGEADYIAQLVRGLLADEAHPTVGIVAFSEAQQGTIERSLARLAESDRVFERALEAEYEREDDGQLCGLFVKNLENVQGDERDIIILSVCYGPNAQGRMRMNFGPINKGGGEKRLNVVFSRAKRHMAVVSSIRHSAITNEYNDGARCLARYLQYSAAMSRGDVETAGVLMRALGGTAHVASTRKATPVVDALATALQEQGVEVQRDVGTSGFRIDLALRHAGAPTLQVAVLVDTEEHYAGVDVFERSHLRPTVLRAFGWRVLWVLTKDWVAEPDRCVQRVLKALASIPEVPSRSTSVRAPTADRNSAPSAVDLDALASR